MERQARGLRPRETGTRTLLERRRRPTATCQGGQSTQPRPLTPGCLCRPVPAPAGRSRHHAVLLQHLQRLLHPSVQLLLVRQVQQQLVLRELQQHARDLLCEVRAGGHRLHQHVELLAVDLPLHLHRVLLVRGVDHGPHGHAAGRVGRPHGLAAVHAHALAAVHLAALAAEDAAALAVAPALPPLVLVAFAAALVALVAPLEALSLEALGVALAALRAAARLPGALGVRLAALGPGRWRVGGLGPGGGRVQRALQELPEARDLQHVGEEVGDL
mmetsp:Transcript_109919/g.354925  ORF Transcript_109919/g.354925 Transcript_109919/m.354925 type:complete len:273 (+) Transcript_109919:67-885(+)